MSDAEAERIQTLLDDPEFIEKLRRQLEEDTARAVKCICGSRCDPPFGDGKKCMVCLSMPTAKDMSIIVY